MNQMTHIRKKICLAIIEKFTEEKTKFAEQETHVELNTLEVTSIWKTPQRLTDSEEAQLLYHVLSNRLNDGYYEDPLEVLLKIVKSDFPEKTEVHEKLGGIFTLLLGQILRIAKRQTMDYHVVVSWLEAGDNHFCKENHLVLLNTKCYALLEAAHLVNTWKSKHECYPCGCIQKQIIELFKGNNNSRLFEALHSIVKCRVGELNPSFRRIFQSMIADISPIDAFSYYIEILQELKQCSAIDISDDQSPSSLIQLTGLLWEMKDENVPKACFEMHRFLISNNEVKEKQKSAVETVLKSKLVPKIFDCLMNNRNIKLDGFDRDSMQKLVDLINKDHYSSVQKSLAFAPLQLLNFLFTKHAIWTKSRNYVNSRIDSLNLSTQQGPVIAFYILSLMYKHDNSLLNHFIDVLERQYTKAHQNNKNRILLILEITEQLGNSNPVFSEFFKENRVKTKLLLETELDSAENVKLVFEYLSDLNSKEFNQFLQQKSQCLTEKSWDELFVKIKDINTYVTSDDVWQCAVERKSSNENVVEFIENQLKILIAKKERTKLGCRLAMIFGQLRSVSLSTKLPSRELLFAVPKILFSLTNTEYSLLPHTTTSSMIPVLILLFCFFSEGSEQNVTNIFHSFVRKMKNGDEVAAKHPIELMKDICEIIKSGKTAGCDMNFMRMNGMPGGCETFLKTINDVVTDDSLRNSFQNPESFARAKERIVEMCSVLLGSIALQIQTLGDRGGKTPFCQLALMLDKYISTTLPTSFSNSKCWQITERVICGFAGMTEKWNPLFVRPRVLNILKSAKSHHELLKRLITIVQENQVLLNLLKKKDDYSQLEDLANTR